MKSFLGGLALAMGMALLSGTATPPPSLCILFPGFESAALVEATDDTCIAACKRRSNP